jgi:hypothetical protein
MLLECVVHPVAVFQKRNASSKGRQAAANCEQLVSSYAIHQIAGSHSNICAYHRKYFYETPHTPLNQHSPSWPQ